MRSRILIIVIAVVLGLAAAFLAGQYIQSARLRIEADARPVEVLVATQDLSPGMTAEQLAEDELVTTVEIPGQFVSDGALSTLGTVAGQVLSSPVSKDEQLTHARFDYASQAGLAFTVPQDYLAVSISNSAVIGVAGLLRPGDSVVVIATFEETSELATAITKIIIPKARVLAVGSSLSSVEATVAVGGGLLSSDRAGDDTGMVPNTITLALSPQDVEKIVFAEREGNLRLALLGSGATDVPATVGATYEQIIQ